MAEERQQDGSGQIRNGGSMNTGNSIPVQIGQRTSKGKLSGAQWASLEATEFDEMAGLKETAIFAPFTAEELAAPEGSSATERDLLLMEHLPTVRYLARRIHERLPQHVELDDLVSAGVVGLIDAFSKFDHKKKVQFKSYAQFRIRGAILDSLRTLDWSPRELRRKGRAVEEAIRSVTQRVGRAPSEQEIAREMELTLAEYQALLGDLKGLEIGSLHMERSEDSGDEELAYVPGAPEDDPLFRCLKGEMKQRLADAIDELPEKERMVLTLYYYEELTMKEIGLTLGVVESRVSQIHSSAVLRLRASLASLRLGDSVGVVKAKASKRKTGTR
jgi:RNA polymerase sigma factor for flagellar operon FliA